MPVRGRCSVFAIAGGSSFAGYPFTWNLLFARQPEPDLEFMEEWLDETSTIRSPAPVQPPRPSNNRPLLWVLFFLLMSGGAYVATEPEMVTRHLGSLLNDPPAPQPPVARNQTPPIAAPSEQPEQDWSFLAPGQTTTPSAPTSAPIMTASAPAKAPPTATSEKQPDQDWSFLATADTPAPSSPADSAPVTASAPALTSPSATQPEQDWSFLATTYAPPPSAPADSSPVTASAPATTVTPSRQSERERAFLARIQSIRDARHTEPGTRGSPAPLFHEGQRVSVRLDLNAPSWTILLRQDAEGTRPGPAVLPGTVLTILDGDLQGRNWVYLVRSDTGSEGWLGEGQLRFKP